MSFGSLSSSAVLAAFAEPFVESRRVLVFGDSLSATPRLLLERGARLVHVCDPAPLRVAEARARAAAPGLVISGFSDEALQSREGEFDCVLVEHLGAFDARAVVAKARRLLAPRGVALFSTPNREAVAPLLPAPEAGAAPLDYYALYDLVSAEFEHVRMFGQAPFVGYAVVDFAPAGTPEPVIDSEFLPRGSEEPESFVALAAHKRPALGSYTVVQLPAHRVLAAPQAATARVTASASAPSETAAAEAARLAELTQKLTRQEAWIAELESRAETADARADEAQEALDQLEAELLSVRAELLAAKAEPPDFAEHRKQLESAGLGEEERKALAERVRELGERLGERDRAIAERDTRIAERDRTLSSQLVTLAERDARLAQREEVVAERDRALAARDARIAELAREAAGDSSDEAARELTDMEARLAERAREIRRLERDVAESERIGRELLAELGRTARAADQGLSQKLEELAARLARSEADRLALTWATAVRRLPDEAV